MGKRSRSPNLRMSSAQAIGHGRAAAPTCWRGLSRNRERRLPAGVMSGGETRRLEAGAPGSWSQGMPGPTRRVAIDQTSKRNRSRCNLRAFSIPKGLRPPAQGCEERATLGAKSRYASNPERVAAFGPPDTAAAQPFQGGQTLGAISQGSSFLATLGFGAESRWDSFYRSVIAERSAGLQVGASRASVAPGRRPAPRSSKWRPVGICWLLLLAMILPAAGGTPPSFRVVPHDTNACAGSDVTFYVEATGDQPLDFSWLRNGLPLTTGVVSTATNSWVTVNNVQLPDFGAAFEVVVTNLSGSTNSPKAHLYVYMPPHVIQEPTNQSVAVGDTVVFSVMAGPMSLDYRWWFQGSPLTNGGSVSGADTATLTISNVQKTDAGYYRAAISNGCLVADSVPARCDVGPVTITIQPFSLTAPFQSSVQYAVGASGSPPLFYKWYRNDLVIAGATTSALNLTSVQRPEVGVYHAVVNNAHGAAASDRAHLQVELTFEGTLLAREEATDHPLSLTNALRTFVPVPTVVFHGAPLLFSTYDASAEQWETRCGVAPSHSMWLLYHAPRTEITKVSTEGSDFDTVLAVYNSDNPSNPTIIACDNNSGYDV